MQAINIDVNTLLNLLHVLYCTVQYSTVQYSAVQYVPEDSDPEPDIPVGVEKLETSTLS